MYHSYQAVIDLNTSCSEQILKDLVQDNMYMLSNWDLMLLQW
jgi:hypothetical protein